LTFQGNKALLAGDADGAILAYERALGLDPSLTSARVNLAIALLSQGRNREALAEIEATLQEEPDHPDGLFLRGEALYREERMEEAIGSWRRAEEVSPSARTRKRLEKAEREQEVAGNYLRTGGAHFTLRLEADGGGGGLEREILAFLEERFVDMVGRYNHLPESSIVVILYPMDDFHDVTQTPKWTGGLFDGKIRVPVGGVVALNERLRRVLMHELTHAFVYSKTRGNCPTWLQEGLAQFEEGQRASSGTLYNLAKSYRTGRGTQWGEEMDYAAALALTEYLLERYQLAALLQMLDRLRGGASEDEAARQVLGKEMEAVLQDWGESLARRSAL